MGGLPGSRLLADATHSSLVTELFNAYTPATIRRFQYFPCSRQVQVRHRMVWAIINPHFIKEEL